MKKRWILCLALIMAVAALAGCSPTDGELMEGKWTGQADLAAAYKSMLAGADPTVAAHMDLGEFTVRLTVQFKEDGTYRVRADQEDLEAGAARMEAAIRAGLAAYMQAETGKTMDNLLAAAGMTMDEVMEQYFDADLALVVRQNLESEGTYKVSGGKLILMDEDGSKVFEGKYDVDEETLKLKSGVTSDLIASLLPLELERK